jgi:hypothetical protein
MGGERERWEMRKRERKRERERGKEGLWHPASDWLCTARGLAISQTDCFPNNRYAAAMDPEKHFLGGATPIGGWGTPAEMASYSSSPTRGLRGEGVYKSSEAPTPPGNSSGVEALRAAPGYHVASVAQAAELALARMDPGEEEAEAEEEQDNVEWAVSKPDSTAVGAQQSSPGDGQGGGRGGEQQSSPGDGQGGGQGGEQQAPQSRKGGKRARGMVLRWALLKALGPDRWHFAALLDSDRASVYSAAISRAVGAGAGTVADVGGMSGLLSMFAARCEAKPKVRIVQE